MTTPTVDLPTTERNKAVIRDLTDAFNDKDKDPLLACYADEVLCHYDDGAQTLTRDEMWARILEMFEVMPDMRGRIDSLLAEDDRVVVRWVFEGTQEGALGGFPPTGRTATWERWFDYRLDAAGQVVEMWWLVDSLSLLEQLGHVELPES